ncbi:hypothetical protein IJ847_01235 [Candidatus Saccharibacteria bacterium]|nr:hypothetical protein [Candidatus Saccharibacteria bacterium]
MAIIDAEDKQALRELAFGATEKVKDKIWRAVLLAGLLVVLILGIITVIRNHESLDNLWLLVSIFATNVGLMILIISLRIFRTMHAQLRKILIPITFLCIAHVVFALLAPVYVVRYDAPKQCITKPCPQVEEKHRTFIGATTSL